MEKFRHFKGRLVSSRRESQKISEQELCCARERSLGRIRLYLSAKLQDDVHRIREEHYKLASTMGQPVADGSQSMQNQQGKIHKRQGKGYPQCLRQNMRKGQQLPVKEEIRVKDSKLQDFSATVKKKALTNPSQERQSFGKILELMRAINQLQQRKNMGDAKEAERFSREIRMRQKEVKQLVGTIEDYSQRNLLDFYCEEVGSPHSSDSFNSQNSDKTYQLNSEREALELSDEPAPQPTSQFEIKYRRISAKSTNEVEGQDNTFLDEIEDTGGLPESPIGSSEHNIVHLFSYDQEKYLESPLSKISERDSEYYSPGSKNCPSSLFSVESLEYKKIFYLLETTEKKGCMEGQQKEVSQFTGQSSRQGTLSLESVDRSRCREQLSEMIALLERKYNRKVRGAENVMDLLNEPCRVNVLGQVK